MQSSCRFDDALPRMVAVLARQLGREIVEAGVVLRDAVGCLAFFSNADLDTGLKLRLEIELRDALGPYARPDRLLVSPSEPGAQRVLADATVLTTRIDAGEAHLEIRCIDRRIVGAEWMTVPISPAPAPDALHRAPRVAFASLKGGVGRSTALTVVADELAREGKNLLVVDLDLEAPGIGSLLLSEDRLPAYGVIDYLVERNLVTGTQDRVGVDDPLHPLVAEMCATSVLTMGAGIVDVVPAFGTRSSAVPGNYLAKLSRAMLDAGAGDGGSASLSQKLADMLQALETIRRYDLVLLDVRAGLSELAAGPLLGLNAEVLIFATAQQQTLQDLRFLLAHLSWLVAGRSALPWARLKMVHAKAKLGVDYRPFRDDVADMFATYLYEEAEGLEEFNFAADDPDAPHAPITIPLEPEFADWDPARRPDSRLKAFYERTFGDLIAYVRDLIPTSTPDGQDD